MSPDLESIRASLATLAAASSEIPPDQVPGLVADLARAQAALLAAASRPPVAQRDVERPEPDHLLGVEEAAAQLGVGTRWLYRHGRDLPFTRRISRKVVRYSQAGIVRWLASRRP